VKWAQENVETSYNLLNNNKVTTSKRQVCSKLKAHLYCSSWIIVRDEQSRVTSMEEQNFVHFIFPNWSQ